MISQVHIILGANYPDLPYINHTRRLATVAAIPTVILHATSIIEEYDTQ